MVLRIVRRCAWNCLHVIVLLTILAQLVIWTSTQTEFQYVYDAPRSNLDSIWNMDSTWNHNSNWSHSSSWNHTDHTAIGDIRNKMEDVSSGSLSDLLAGLTLPTRSCRKMVQLGGYHCRRRPDGTKTVCLDDVVYPGRDYCLGYSFGVGNDFSFDQALADFGCQVYAFDQDSFINRYPRTNGDGVILVKIRLGKSATITNLQLEDGTWFKYIYRPLNDIQTILKHGSVTLDYLKMDIEGDEWDVFTDSILKTDILQRTKQLALEFHLVALDSSTNKSEQQRQEGIKKYQSVIDGIRECGFELVWFEPNFKVPVTSTIGDRTFHLYGETLWINVQWKKPQFIPKKFENHISNGITRRKVHTEKVGWSWPDLNLNSDDEELLSRN